MAHDVFAHHNRVVNQQSDTQRQRHQRQVVQRKSERVQSDESRHHRNRQSQCRDHRAAPRSQEHEHDQHGEQSAFEDGAFHAIDAGLHVLRLIGKNRQFDVCRQLFFQPFNRHFYAFANFHCVAATHLEHVQADGANTVDSRKTRLLLIAINNGGHVG